MGNRWGNSGNSGWLYFEGLDRGWNGWMVSPIQWTWVWVNSGSLWEAWHTAVNGVAKSWTRMSDWTELNWMNTWVQMFSLNPLSTVTNKFLGTDKGSWYSKLRNSLVCCSFLPCDIWREDVGSPRGEFSSPICSGNFSELWNERKRSWSHPQEYCMGRAAPCFL